LDEFVPWLLQHFDVGLWSSCTQRNLDPIVQSVFTPEVQAQFMFILDQSACAVDGYLQTEEGSQKERFIKDLQQVTSTP
jgi:hypothetical protein